MNMFLHSVSLNQPTVTTLMSKITQENAAAEVAAACFNFGDGQ